MDRTNKRGRHAGAAADNGLVAFIRDHPARVYGVATSLLTLLAVYVPAIPQDAILAVLAALLWGGDVVQRAENAKTREAMQVQGREPPK